MPPFRCRLRSRLQWISLITLWASATALAEPVSGTGVWNGFNRHATFTECSNSGPAAELLVHVFSNENVLLGTLPLNLPPRSTKHLSLDTFPTVDAYGTYRVVVASGDANRISCHTVTYRFQAEGADEHLEYAFSLPILQPLTEASSGIFNSFNPTASPEPVYNWLSVINLSAEPGSFSVKVYNLDGTLNPDAGFRVANLRPGQRRDYALGHPSGFQAGIYRIEPDDSRLRYSAFVTRYAPGEVAGTFTYAFPLLSAKPTCASQTLNASTMGQAYNWLEIANPGDSSIRLRVSVKSSDGVERFNTESLSVPAHSQQHLPLHEFLGPENTGFVALECVDESQSGVIAQAIFYGRRPSGVLDWAYGSQATLPLSSELTSAYIPLNTFLGASNWHKVVNLSGARRQFRLTVYDALGREVREESFSLAGGSAVDLNLHERVGPDFVGLGVVTSDSTTFPSELLRVFNHRDGSLAYILNVPSGYTSPFAEETCLAHTIADVTRFSDDGPSVFQLTLPPACSAISDIEIIGMPAHGDLVPTASGWEYTSTDQVMSDSLTYRVCLTTDTVRRCGQVKILNLVACSLEFDNSLWQVAEGATEARTFSASSACGGLPELEILEHPTRGALVKTGQLTLQYTAPWGEGPTTALVRVCDTSGAICRAPRTLNVFIARAPQFSGDEGSLAPYRENLTAEELRHLVWKIGMNSQELLANGGDVLTLTGFVDSRLLNENWYPPSAKAELDALRDAGVWFRMPANADQFITVHDNPPPARNEPAALFPPAMQFNSPSDIREGFEQYLAVSARSYHGTLHRYYWGWDYANPYLIMRARYLSPAHTLMSHLLLGHLGTSTANLNGNEEHYVGLLHRMIEREALGNFRELILGTGPNGCAIVAGQETGILCEVSSNKWLDHQLNTATNPNENFPRELMELYLLSPTDPVTGAANYTNADVASVTRFLSGMTYGGPATGMYFSPGRHDSGNYSAFQELAVVYPSLAITNRSMLPGQFVAHLFDHHPALARHIARRVFAALVYPEPSDEIIEELAYRFKTSGYDLKSLLRTVVRSQAMFSQRSRGGDCIASPLKIFSRLINGFELSLVPISSGVDDKVLQARQFFTKLRQQVASAGETVLGYPSVFSYDYCGRDPGKNGVGEWLQPTVMLNRVRGMVAFLNNQYQMVGSSRHPLEELATQIPAADPEAGPTKNEFLDFFASRLRLTLSSEERAIMTDYLSHNMNGSGQKVPVAWTPKNAAFIRQKIAGILVIMGNHPLANME